MAGNSAPDLPLWSEFEQAARKRRRNPVRLLTEFMRDCMESWEEQRLDGEVRRDAAASGSSEELAVEIVRQYREEKARRSDLPRVGP